MSTTDEPRTSLPARRDAFAPERPPIIDQLNPRMKELLQSRSPGLREGELAAGVELAAAYQLDPFANEIWFTKSRGRDGREGKLLIMVGRDGLRKIAQRNALELEGDVVHERDRFTYSRQIDATGNPYHEVEHVVNGFERGPILGSWCRAYERESKIERGWFVAPLSEYDPTIGASPDSAMMRSPWAKQTTVMILAAAERQAARQATPLGGLLVEGEDDVIDGTAEPMIDLPDQPYGPVKPLPEAVQRVLDLAREVGHAGLSNEYAVRLRVTGQPDAAIETWAAQAMAELSDYADQHADEQPVAFAADAEVVDAPGEPDDPERDVDHETADLEGRAADLRAELEADQFYEDTDAKAAARAELEQLEAELDRRRGQ